VMSTTMHIQKFVNKLSVMETKQNKDVVLNIADARGLRDDILRLLADLHELNIKVSEASSNGSITQIEISGGSFKQP